jgi:rhamnosyltransferase subunit B
LPQPLHVILASVGTDGDVFPYIGLGVALRRRGHRATLVACEGYRPLAEASGLAFRALVSQAENDRCFGDPDFWHPLKGPRVAGRWGVALIPRQYELFAELAGDARDGRVVFVASPGLVAARVAQERLGVPLASVVLQPWMIRSCATPPVMPMGLTLPRWAPRPLGQLYWRGLGLTVGLMMGRSFNALRARLGLPNVRDVFRWWLSPSLVIGMFPDWYGPPQPDWPGEVRLTGFPMFDGAGAELPRDLSAFLDAPHGGPPVAFTFGTGMRHASPLFAAAAEACRMLGLRGVFLTRHPDQLPAPLPPHVVRVDYAPFSRLFPRCAAVVHHGGVGTVAQALAAGVAQLVLPIAYDQFDNATRVKRLGAGDWLPARRADAARVAAALAKLLTPAARASSAAGAAAVAAPSGPAGPLDTAAGLVEELGKEART